MTTRAPAVLTNRWIQLVIPFIQNVAKGTVDSGMKRPIESSLKRGQKWQEHQTKNRHFRCGHGPFQIQRKTRPTVIYAKDWLDLVLLSGLEKGFTLDVITRGQSTTIFLCIRPFSAWLHLNKRPNNQVILVQACSWSERRQSFAGNTKKSPDVMTDRRSEPPWCQKQL